MNNIDLDINSYSNDELFNIFNLNNNCEKITLDEKFKENQELILKLENEVVIEDKIKMFFRKVYNNLSNQIITRDDNTRFQSQKDDLLLQKQQLEIEKMKLEQLKLEHACDVDSNKIRPVYTTNESNYALNPITPNTVKKQIAISSDYRKRIYEEELNPNYDRGTLLVDKKRIKDVSTSSDFIVELPEPFANVISMEVVSSDIPIINYNITEKKGNNKFRITMYTEADTGQSTEILIPDGFWYSAALTDYLNENYFTPEASVIPEIRDKLVALNLTYLTINIDETTAKTTLRFKTDNEIEANKDNAKGMESNANGLSFTIENIDDSGIFNCKNRDMRFSKTCLGIFGYTISDIYDITHSTNNSYNTYSFELKKFSYDDLTKKIQYGNHTYNGNLISSEVYGNGIDKCFYIAIDDFIGNHGEQILLFGNANLISKNIITRCQLKNDPFQMNTGGVGTDYSIKREYYGDVRIRKLHIQILNDSGEVVNLQNFPVNLVIEFVMRYSTERQYLFNKNIQ